MTAAFVLGLAYALFVFYLAYVALWVAHKNGKLGAAPLPVRAVAWSILAIAIVLDVVFNATVGSVAFLEPPELRRPPPKPPTSVSRRPRACSWTGMG